MTKVLPAQLKQATMLDNIWLVSFPLLKSMSIQPGVQLKSPNWSGFMQFIVTGNNYHVSGLQIVPFINLDPKKAETVYSACYFVQS